jgi:uncharacterized protein YjiS (DUF1127 family)
MSTDVQIIATHPLGLTRSETKSGFSSCLQLLDTWWERIEYRRNLRRLLAVGPHMIEDVGLALEAADAEAMKLFWEE